MANRLLLPTSFLAILAATPMLRAQTPLTPRSSAVFATLEAAERLLTERDDFVARLSPFDRAARLKSAADVSVDEYLKFVEQNALAWPAEVQAKVTAALAAISPKLAELNVPLPATVHFIHTTGNEEGGAAYTRGSSIILPQTRLEGVDAKALENLVAHELFHVLSRTQPELRQKLYVSIGFEPCGEVDLPADLNERRITNPDAPHNDYAIQVEIEGTPRWVVPILYSRTEKYDATAGGEFFNYLEFRLMAVDLHDRSPATPTLIDIKPHLVGLPYVKPLLIPLLVEPAAVKNFFEQIGNNTKYIIHPDEILADNFALLITGAPANDPELLRKIEKILCDYPAATESDKTSVVP